MAYSSKIQILFVVALMLLTAQVRAECDTEPGYLVLYEQEILKAAESKDVKLLATYFACLLKAQNESEGSSKFLAHSFLSPLLGGTQNDLIKKDTRYQVVAKFLEEIALRSPSGVQRSFIAEFSRGDWRFYTLFCEQGNTDFCETFMPDEKSIRKNPPLLAAASMLRLKKAYQVLKGPQREVVAKRIKNLFKEIPQTDRLQRRLIEEIHGELFPPEIPVSLLG